MIPSQKIPDPGPENPEKPVAARFALLRLNQGTYRHGRGTHGIGLDLRITLVPLKIRNSGSQPS